jgi:tetratricopeptide (TPR) repeat protein
MDLKQQSWMKKGLILLSGNTDDKIGGMMNRMFKILARIFVLTAVILLGCNTTANKTYYDDIADFEDEEKVYAGVSYFVALGDIESAIKAYEEALAKDPYNPKTINLYARLQLLAGLYDDARVTIEDAMELDVLFSLSLLESASGNIEQQKSILERIIELDPEHLEALSSLGEIYLKEKRFEESRELFEKVLEKSPDDFTSLMGLGNVLIRQEEWSQAEEKFDKVLELYPDYPFSYSDRGYIRRKQGLYSQAIEDYTKSIELVPDFYWNYIDRGKLYLAIDEKLKAEEDFLLAISIDPDYFVAHVYVSEIFYERQEWDKAYYHYDKVKQNRSDYYFIYEPLGVLCYQKENWGEAAEMFQSAFNYDKTKYCLHLLAALRLRRDGREEEAVDYLTQTLPDIKNDTWQYNVAQYLIQPEYDAPVLDYYYKETIDLIKKRMLFYIAAQYLLMGMERAAQAYFLDVVQIDQPDSIERILGEWYLKGFGLDE